MKQHRYKDAVILDVGCGRELPMAKMLYSSKMIPKKYYGVDVGPINDEDYNKVKKTGKFPCDVWEKTNFLEITVEEKANTVVCFEVLEHVEPEMCLAMLRHMHDLTTEDARFYVSTPCWNRTDCASNHVNEITYEALGSIFEEEDFIVENVYGTFASIKDYEHLLVTRKQIEAHTDGSTPPGWKELFDSLRDYYDSNFLSCIFAPLFPAQSRNCMWVLKKRGNDTHYGFPGLDKCKTPWSSSEKWEQMK
jgi:hypothetical protein